MSKSTEQYLEDAIRHYRAAQYREALIACEYAIQHDPICARAYHGRGLILVKQEKYIEALEDYQKSYEIESKNAILHADMGELYFILNDYENSGLFYQKAIQLDREYEADYHRKTQEFVDKALNLNNRELRDEAIATLQQALLFNPADKRAKSYFLTLQRNYSLLANSQYGPSDPYSTRSVHHANCRCPLCINY